MMVGVYENTKTLELLNNNPYYVLQILAADQYRLVDLLGKKSGNAIDKISRLEKRKLVTEWNGFKVLKNALAVMQLKTIDTIKGGDHKVFLCDVVAYKNLNDGIALTLDDLRKHQLIRI